MSIHDPKTKPNKTGRAGNSKKTDPGQQEKKPDQQDKKKKAFDEGLPNNSNTQTGTAQSGYDEKNPTYPGGKQQQQPKVTNQENAITNSEEQNKLDEEQEPVDEQSCDNAPVTEKTERKIPQSGL